MDKLLLKFEKAIAGYGIAHAVPPIDLEISTGEHVALVGENEKRKTEFLEAVAGKIAIPKGRLHCYFTDEYLKHDLHKPIAMVFARHEFKSLGAGQKFYYQQRYNSTDSENSETVSKYLSKIKSFRKKPYWTIPKVVKRLNLKPLEDKKLIKLSNGETRKVLLASALLRNPAILLLDHPMAGLDADSRAFFGSLIPDISFSGITIIMNTSYGEIPEEINKYIVFKNKKPIIKVDADHHKKHQESLASHLPEINLNHLLSSSELAYRHIIKMNNVNVNYKGKQILSKINWTVIQGQRWSLTGKNGAGKSTLLSLINGDNPQAYANDIYLFDRKRGSGESIWDLKSNIGYVSPELFQYFPVNMVCHQVIATAFDQRLTSNHKISEESKNRIVEWMTIMGIENYYNSQFSNVSTNVQRLCLLARALINNPTLLILDEPFQGFSEEQIVFQKHIIDTACKKTNLTLIFVSHHEEEIPDSITHTIRLENGKQI